MEQKYKIFKEYNWVYSTEWQNYYKNLYPSPPISKLLHYKKKFYRNYIDPDFDINYVPPEGEKQETEYKPPDNVIKKNLNKIKKQNTTNNCEENKEKLNFEKIVEKYKLSKKNYNPINSKVLKYFQLFFLFLFIISIPSGKKTYQFALDAFLIKLFREIGYPIFSKKYIQSLLINETFHSLIYIFLCCIDNFNYYMLLPIILSGILFLSEYLKEIKSLEKTYSLIIKYQEAILQNKSHIEIVIGFLLIVGASLKINTFKIPIIYWNVLRYRYFVNPYVYKSFEELNKKVNEITEKGNIPKFIKYIIEKIQLMFIYFGTIN